MISKDYTFVEKVKYSVGVEGGRRNCILHCTHLGYSTKFGNFPDGGLCPGCPSGVTPA